MKRKLSTSLIIVIILIAFSCGEDPLIPPIIQPIIDTNTEFIKEAKSDSRTEFFISGEFDGIRIYCASTLINSNEFNQTSYNALYLKNSIGLDQINLIRENNENTVKLAIYFSQAKIFTRQFPYKLPHENSIFGESAEIQILNLKILGTEAQNSSEDGFLFYDSTFKSLKIQVTSFVDNIMEGTFEGSMTSNNTSSRIEVKNGKFRIKIKVVNEDL